MTECRPAEIESFLKSYGWLVLLTCILCTFSCGYVLAGIRITTHAELIIAALPPLAIALWVVRDARVRRCTPCFDFGLLVYIGWWLAVPGYLFWTRRWRGLFVLLMFFAMMMTPWISAAVLWVALYGNLPP